MADNPLRWNCTGRGCYLNHIPTFGPLTEATGLAWTDIDAMATMGGRALVLEFKHGDEASAGRLEPVQHYALKTLSASPHITALAVWGDVGAMDFHTAREYRGGVSRLLPHPFDLADYLAAWRGEPAESISLNAAAATAEAGRRWLKSFTQPQGGLNHV